MRQGSKKGLYCEYQKTHYLNWLSQNHAVSWQQSRAINWFKHDGSDSKESAFNTGGPGSIPGLELSYGGGHDNPFQYSCLENPHGQRSLVGYSPCGCKESDMTEVT